MPRTIRQTIDALFSSFPIRFIGLITDNVLNGMARGWSYIRFRALFPQSFGGACHWSVEIKYPKNITLGKHVVIGPSCTIGAKSPVFLEDHVRLSKGVTIETAGLDFKGGLPYQHHSKPITIKQGAWIGTGAMILSGVTIHENAIIGAGTIVTKDVPANSIMVGSPTRLIEMR